MTHNNMYNNFFNNFASTILKSCDAIIIPGRDIHQLEHPMPCFRFRHVLSKFYGSAGTFIICKNNKVGLWTDSRYTQIAKNIFNTKNYTCFISHEQNYEEQINWIHKQNLQTKKIILCPMLHTVSQYSKLTQCIKDKNLLIQDISYQQLLSVTQKFLSTQKNNIYFSKKIDTNIVPEEFIKNERNNLLWDIQQRSNIKKNSQNIKKIINFLLTQEAKYMLISNIHQIAYITGLRSTLLEDVLLFPSLLIIDVNNKCYLFIPKKFLTQKTKKIIRDTFTHLNSSITCIEYEILLQNNIQIKQAFFKIFTKSTRENSTILYDSQTCPQYLFDILKKDNIIIEKQSQYLSYAMGYKEGINKDLLSTNKGTIVQTNTGRSKKNTFFLQDCTPYFNIEKNIRTEKELHLIKKAQIQDSAILLESLADVLQNLKNNIIMHEADVATIIFNKRKQNKGFIKESFSTISASGKNSAIPHYQFNPQKGGSIIKEHIPYLLDCGAHYACKTYAGTSDITRTFLFALYTKKRQTIKNIIKEYKADYTAVLKTHIALATHVFSHNTTGQELDAMVKNILFAQNKRSFGHGTGHGVGFCTDVHEGYTGIHSRGIHTLHNNIVLSNEPGYYINNKWGIRLENLICVKSKNKHQKYFETISFFPFENKLVDKTKLSKRELTWFYEYQKKCEKLLSPHISKKTKELFFS